MRMRRTLTAGATALGALAAVVAFPANAQAGRSVPNCASGYVCAFTKSWGGSEAIRSEGNWTAGKYPPKVVGIFNNGNRYPGADHIYFKGFSRSSLTSLPKPVSGCLHYYQGNPDTSERYAVVFTQSTWITEMKWGGEC